MCSPPHTAAAAAAAAAEGDRPIPPELFDDTGELDIEHMFCSKCKLNHADDVSRQYRHLGCAVPHHRSCADPPIWVQGRLLLVKS